MDREPSTGAVFGLSEFVGAVAQERTAPSSTDPAVAAPGEWVSVGSAGPMPGAAGTQVLTIAADAPGAAVVAASYDRPWEGDEKGLWTPRAGPSTSDRVTRGWHPGPGSCGYPRRPFPAASRGSARVGLRTPVATTRHTDALVACYAGQPRRHPSYERPLARMTAPQTDAERGSPSPGAPTHPAKLHTAQPVRAYDGRADAATCADATRR